MQHSCHYKKLDLACDSYNLSFEKHESSSSLHVKTLFLWWKCVFQMLEYWAMQPGQYCNTWQYWATVSQMPRYCWASWGIPQITCSLSLASATIYTGIISPLFLMGWL